MSLLCYDKPKNLALVITNVHFCQTHINSRYWKRSQRSGLGGIAPKKSSRSTLTSLKKRPILDFSLCKIIYRYVI